MTNVPNSENRMGSISLRRISYHLLAGVAFTASSLAACGALAQSSEVQLDAIEVEGQVAEENGTGPVKGYVAKRSTTATKTDKPLIKTPQSVSVVSREQMDDQSAQSVGEALRYTAGVLGETRMSAGRYDSVFIRGFGGFGSSAGYVNFLDGLRTLRGINYLVPATEPFGLERVEVLRGPASVLFGQVAPGGIVNQVSKRPTEESFGEIQLQGGTHDRVQAAFDISGAANAEKTVLYRLVGLGRTSDTQVDYTQEERVYFAPSFTFRPSDDTTFTVLASYQKDPETGFYGFLPAVGTVLPNPNGKLPSSFFPGEPGFEGFSRENLSIGYEFEHRFDDVFTVRQKLRFSDLESEVNTISVASLDADNETLHRRALTAIEDAKTLSVDNHVQADFATGALSHTVLAGVDLQWMEGNSWLGVSTAVPDLNMYDPVYGTVPIARPALSGENQEQTQIGVYVQDQMEFDRWIVLAGGRFDNASSSLLNRTSNTTVDKDDSAATGRAALMYNFDSGLAPYASISSSFDPTPGSDFDGNPFKPTEGLQYEAGLKYQPPGYDALFQASLYDLTQTNVLTQDPDRPGTPFRVQTGEIRSRGLELEARATLWDNFDVIAAYAYTDVEITESNSVDLGKRPPVVPEHMASIWGHYRFTDGALGGLGVGAGVRFVGEGAGDAANTFDTPSYTLVDAVLSYDLGVNHPEFEGWKMQINARNLLDEEYISGCYSLTGCNYGLRRTVLGTLSYRW